MKARRVVVVAWEGGVRSTETLLDPAHRFVPRLWNEMVPQGTLVSRLTNDGWTNHDPSLYALATGRWQTRHYADPVLDPDGALAAVARRRGVGSLVITRAGRPRSLILSGGEPFGVVEVELSTDPAPLERAEHYALRSFDRPVTAEFLRRGAGGPPLVYLVFDDADMAHQGRWSWYTGAIRQADELLARIWERLRAEGDSDLVVVPLHGRCDHGETRWGFRGHGRDDEGCARLWMLALGPDFPAGRVVDRPARLVDVAPTVAHLLGLEFRSRGRVLREALT
jgi:hypothetical protein